MIEKKPFVNYRIGEPDPLAEGKIFTIRLNAVEYKDLVAAMQVLHISNHSTALKELAFVGKNVILALFTPTFLRWLSDGNRRVDENKLHRLKMKLEENVNQVQQIP